MLCEACMLARVCTFRQDTDVYGVPDRTTDITTSDPLSIGEVLVIACDVLICVAVAIG